MNNNDFTEIGLECMQSYEQIASVSLQWSVYYAKFGTFASNLTLPELLELNQIRFINKKSLKVPKGNYKLIW